MGDAIGFRIDHQLIDFAHAGVCGQHVGPFVDGYFHARKLSRRILGR